MIVKVQLSTMHNGQAWTVRGLIYNRSRSVMVEVEDVPAAVVIRLGGERKVRAEMRVKGYFKARVSGSQVELGDRVPEQGW